MALNDVEASNVRRSLGLSLDSSVSPVTQGIFAEAVRLRDIGRYHESESRFRELSGEILQEVSVQNALAMLYAFQGNYGQILTLFPACPDTKRSKDDSFSTLLWSYSKMHTELMLAEAVGTSAEIWKTWLEGRNVEEYNDIDVGLRSLCGLIISNLGVYCLFLPHHSRMGEKIARG